MIYDVHILTTLITNTSTIPFPLNEGLKSSLGNLFSQHKSISNSYLIFNFQNLNIYSLQSRFDYTTQIYVRVLKEIGWAKAAVYLEHS